MYYGDEIGHGQTCRFRRSACTTPGRRTSPASASAAIPSARRCSGTTSANAGFTDRASHGCRWLATWRQCNVAAEGDDAASLLSFYRALLQLRRNHRALALGSFSLVAAEGDLLAYERKTRDETLFVALNFGDADQPVETTAGQVLLSTHGHTGAHDGTLVLRPHEGVILQVT